MMILAIDNDKKRLSETADLLRSMFPNDSIMTEHDPLAAIKYACNNPVDIMFAALDMRPMDGILFVQAVRRVGENIKVYITSGPKHLDDEFLFEDEADGFLSEPLTEYNIREVLSGKAVCS